MRKGEKRWLRLSVVFAIVMAQAAIVLAVMITGATQEVPFLTGTLTAAANSTFWEAATVWNSFSMGQILIPIVLIGVAIILLLCWCVGFSALKGGMG